MTYKTVMAAHRRQLADIAAYHPSPKERAKAAAALVGKPPEPAGRRRPAAKVHRKPAEKGTGRMSAADLDALIARLEAEETAPALSVEEAKREHLARAEAQARFEVDAALGIRPPRPTGPRLEGNSLVMYPPTQGGAS